MFNSAVNNEKINSIEKNNQTLGLENPSEKNLEELPLLLYSTPKDILLKIKEISKKNKYQLNILSKIPKISPHYVEDIIKIQTTFQDSVATKSLSTMEKHCEDIINNYLENQITIFKKEFAETIIKRYNTTLSIITATTGYFNQFYSMFSPENISYITSSYVIQKAIEISAKKVGNENLTVGKIAGATAAIGLLTGSAYFAFRTRQLEPLNLQHKSLYEKVQITAAEVLGGGSQMKVIKETYNRLLIWHANLCFLVEEGIKCNYEMYNDQYLELRIQKLKEVISTEIVIPLTKDKYETADLTTKEIMKASNGLRVIFVHLIENQLLLTSISEEDGYDCKQTPVEASELTTYGETSENNCLSEALGSAKELFIGFIVSKIEELERMKALHTMVAPPHNLTLNSVASPHSLALNLNFSSI